MKKFVALLLIFMIVFSFNAFADDSEDTYMTISSIPRITNYFAKRAAGWNDVLERLKLVEDETKEYKMVEAIVVILDKSYEKTSWKLPVSIMTEHEPFVYIIGSEAIVKQEVGFDENNRIIIDFSDFNFGCYYICFYVKAL